MVYFGKVSGKRDRGRPRLTFENTVSKPPEGMYEEVDDFGRSKRGTVVFGAPFSLITPLGIQREDKLSFI